jgi:hypothetical protein
METDTGDPVLDLFSAHAIPEALRKVKHTNRIMILFTG